MAMAATAQHDPVTLLIPHYQTPDAIRLCLRSIRRYTAPPYRVLVLDNGSRDGSREYVRSVRWAECIDTGVLNDRLAAHAAALNIGVSLVDTPYFAVCHSDTYVHRAGWLSFLLRRLQRGAYAAVGTRHQTIPAHDSALLARLADRTAGLLSRVSAREIAAGVPRIRSCLALYRTDAFRAVAGRFSSADRQDATYAPNRALAEHGYRLLALPDRVLGYYLFHKGDTTRLANRLFPPEDLPARIDRHSRIYLGFHERRTTQAILGDASLDA